MCVGVSVGVGVGVDRRYNREVVECQDWKGLQTDRKVKDENN
jgi:hypothetical protein